MLFWFWGFYTPKYFRTFQAELFTKRKSFFYVDDLMQIKLDVFI